MQAELLLRDMEPPSYEESIDVKQLIGQIKAQRRKTPPPSYESNGIFDVFRHTQLLDNKNITPSVIGKTITESPMENCHDDEMEQNSPMEERLELVSSCLQQMIDAANQSLTSNSTIQPLPLDPDTTDNMDENDTTSLGDVLKEQKKKNQQWRINRNKSLERLKSSQDSLARTIDQLNSSITQHIVNEAAPSTTYNYTQYHHQHYYNQDQPNSTKRHRQQSMIPLWTNILTQAALVFGICHQLLSWSTPTSSILSVAWLLTRLIAKKKTNHRNSGFIMPKSLPSSSSYYYYYYYYSEYSTMVSFYSQLKASLVPHYSTLLSIFRKQ